MIVNDGKPTLTYQFMCLYSLGVNSDIAESRCAMNLMGMRIFPAIGSSLCWLDSQTASLSVMMTKQPTSLAAPEEKTHQDKSRANS